MIEHVARAMARDRNRLETFKHLSELYGLDARLAVFRLFRRFWDDDEAGYARPEECRQFRGQACVKVVKFNESGHFPASPHGACFAVGLSIYRRSAKTSQC